MEFLDFKSPVMDCLGSFAFLDDKEWFVLLDEAGAIDLNMQSFHNLYQHLL